MVAHLSPNVHENVSGRTPGLAVHDSDIHIYLWRKYVGKL